MTKEQEHYCKKSREEDYYNMCDETFENGFKAAQSKEAIALMSAEQLMENELVREIVDHFKYMRSIERSGGEVIVYRYDESLCEQALAPFDKVEE